MGGRVLSMLLCHLYLFEKGMQSAYEGGLVGMLCYDLSVEEQ